MIFEFWYFSRLYLELTAVFRLGGKRAYEVPISKKWFLNSNLITHPGRIKFIHESFSDFYNYKKWVKDE